MIEIPETFRTMPRWQSEGAAWLDSLPDHLIMQMRGWELRPDRSAPVRHGSNALVVPVERKGEPLALRLTPPGPSFAEEVAALRFWRGRGVVQLVAADLPAGAMLLERLDGSHTAEELPVEAGVAVTASMMRRLAVEPAPDAPRTGDVVRARLPELETDWEHLGRPFPRRTLDAVTDAAEVLTNCIEDVAVNADLHAGQVLAGQREPWLCVDPRLMRGDVCYDLARVLWTRLDEMAGDGDIRRMLAVAVNEAGLDPERARTWVAYRATDYWLWGLRNGLTHDPMRCSRLLTAIGVHQP